MKEFIQRNKALVGAGAVIGVVVLAVLAFGVFGIQTAFFDNEVSEAGPVFASGATTATTAEPDTDGAEGTDDSATEQEQTEDTAPAAEPASDPVITTVAAGAFEDSAIHAGTGDAVVLTDGTQTFLRFEDNFATDNGPDLNVYLRANDGSGDYLDLGDLKGNIGSQNYEIPEGTDLSRFTEIDIWCVRFGVSFADAQLTAV